MRKTLFLLALLMTVGIYGCATGDTHSGHEGGGSQPSRHCH